MKKGVSEKKLLIIDDDINTRDLLLVEFEDEGYDVFVAKDAFEGLDTLRFQAIDLVMLDLKMPGMDGIEALQKILALNQQIPVIIHSAYSHFKENYLTWLASDYVVKSGDLDALKESVKKNLESTSSIDTK